MTLYSYSAARRAHFWAAVASFATLILGIVLLYRIISFLEETRESEYRAQVQSQLAAARYRLSANLDSTLTLPRGLTAYVRARNGLDEQMFWRLARELYRDSPHVRNIGMAPNNIITRVYPTKGNEAAIGLAYRNLPQQWPAVEQAMRTRETVVAGPVNLVQGGRALVSRTPIFVTDSQTNKEKYWGVISLVVDTESLLKASQLVSDDGKLSYSLRGTDGRGAQGEVFFGSAAVFTMNPVTLPIALPGGSWQLAAVPTKGWSSVAFVPASFYVAAGILLLLLMAFKYYAVYAFIRLRAQAHHDALTGLPNRRLLRLRLRRSIASAARRGRTGAILVLDLDFFKPINDWYGHNVGDALLQHLAGILSANVSGIDTVARVGGDEFVVLLPDVNSRREAERIAARLGEAIQQPFTVGGQSLSLSASIGIAVFPENGTDLDILLECADQEMYQHKNRRGPVFIQDLPHERTVAERTAAIYHRKRKAETPPVSVPATSDVKRPSGFRWGRRR
jgi:diguanylate cyclase